MRRPALLLLALFIAACGSDADKADLDAPALLDGKADSTAVEALGDLGFGDEGAREQPIMGKGRFHSFELDVAPGAQFKVEVSQRGTSRGFDSTLWLYGPADENGRYATETGLFDDDEGWGLLSRLREVESTEGGKYLIVVGKYSGEGNYRLYAECLNGNCAPEVDPLADTCVFGNTYGDIFDGNDAVVVTSYERITSSDQVSGLAAEQLVVGVQNAYEEVTTVQEALDIVDQGYVNFHRLWDVSSNRGFVAIEHGAGDNSYGRILEADSTAIAANISDLDLYDCNAFWGPQRRDCTSNDDCADGLRCEGSRNGMGSCIDTRYSPEGNGDSCTTGVECGAGLVCAGENLGGGFCGPAWMRRTFSVEPNQAIPAGGRIEVPIEVYGLASVSTDVTVSMFVTHDDTSNLRVTLANPLGTTGELFAGSAGRSVYLRDEAVLAYPGDEDANGTWTLVFENPGSSAGTMREFQITVTSRYD